MHLHDHGHDAHEAGRGGMPILIGDAFHNFADGVVIAGAFLVDTQAGGDCDAGGDGARDPA